MATPEQQSAASTRDDFPPGEFTTTRDELFQNLVLNVPHGYVVTEGEYGPGRTYYVTVGDLLDALKAFCDEKEEAA